MNLKQNVNKLHSNISSQFGDVKIEEKSNLKFGNYINIVVTNEGKELNILVTKKDLENTSFNWCYLSNPLNEESDMVERYSNIDSISEDVKDIFNKNRFSSEYLKELSK